jgi:hypothetical protein
LIAGLDGHQLRRCAYGKLAPELDLLESSVLTRCFAVRSHSFSPFATISSEFPRPARD